ncbi:hypothetical protein MWG58_29165 [Streptomyces sp. WAC00276]|uniref:hypothetical protein n=1 Tax=Streptomyces sp. WAC00276 TaxID=2933778 RepID=UPI0020002F17|nr:hypothetical protein [Streptomyces sp. WAC00276]MCK2144916.1 hypothetical protein [Streptomyces sp. WAC00276]
MPTTDSYGQGIPLATLTDGPDLPKAITDLAGGAIPKLVMRFASASARGATLTAPEAGMVTWLTDVARLEVYDGAAWVSFAFGTNAWKSVPLASGWTNNGNNQGTFQYRVVNLFGERSMFFRGGIARSSYPSTIPVPFQLNTTAIPADSRPSTLRTISVPCSDSGSSRITLKLDVSTTGWLNLYGISRPNDLPAWVGFNGCFTSL